MPEINEMWTEVLREAKVRAAATGRGDIVRYIELREANDAARNVGIKWLLNAFLEVANAANRQNLRLTIEQNEAHQFAVGAATMRGGRIKLSGGVRALTVEAGFPRTPPDGFVRGGGLAAAKITHFGLPKANADLLLVRADNNTETAPIWFAVDEQNLRQPFSLTHLKNHFAVFLGGI